MSIGQRIWSQRITILLFLVAVLSIATSVYAADDAGKNQADTLVVNGRVYTVNLKQPWAEAVAIRDGKIVAVGTTKHIESFRGTATRVIDAHQQLVLPGITDCHVHFMDGSLSLGRVNVEDAKSVDEIQQQIKQFADAHPDAKWVLGRGWNYAQFPSGLPDKKYLDAVVPNRPALIEGFDGHTYWANSQALKLAGIDRNTADPPNGAIVRDSNGEPTGALKESASHLVEKMVPEVTPEERLSVLRNGIKEANRLGVTRAHSAGGDFEYLDLYDQLRKNGELSVRFYVAYFLRPAQLNEEAVNKIEAARKTYKDDWLSAGVVKTMLDGVVESHTAAMFAPYGDDPKLTGKLFWDPENYKTTVAELDKRGLQVFTHAIGDRAVSLALDAYAAAETQNKTHGARHRIEHIETIRRQDEARFGKLGVIASMQPLHAYPDDDTLKVWAKGAGKDRASRGFPWQDIYKSNGVLAFGSDWPVVTINPWYGMQNAVTRQTEAGNPKGGWLPEQRVTVAQAIKAYTLDAAFAGHFEKTEGSIEPGKQADLIILSQDLFKVDPHKFRETKVLLTMVGGKVVFDASTPAAQAEVIH
jgi:predicted amidohydrolase YtcJ